jgi:hypothetical protein
LYQLLEPVEDFPCVKFKALILNGVTAYFFLEQTLLANATIFMNQCCKAQMYNKMKNVSPAPKLHCSRLQCEAHVDFTIQHQILAQIVLLHEIPHEVTKANQCLELQVKTF